MANHGATSVIEVIEVPSDNSGQAPALEVTKLHLQVDCFSDPSSEKASPRELDCGSVSAVGLLLHAQNSTSSRETQCWTAHSVGGC
jgi:hypothetical protein